MSTFLVLTLSGLLLAAGSPSAEALYHEGNAAYREGRYQDAEASWRGALQEGVENGHILYNLGNALFRQQELGEAILAWRRAQTFLPRDPDVQANLERARGQVKDRLEPPPAVSPMVFWQRPFSPRESLLLGSLAVGLGLSLLVLRSWRGLHQRLAASVLPLASMSAVLLGLGLLFLGSSLSTLWRWEARPVGVILAPEVTARSTLGWGGVDLFVLREGAEVVVVGRSEDSVLVALPDDRKGWVPASQVGTVQWGSPFPATVPSR